MPKIIIAGGTGLIGSKLIKKLKQKKYEILVLSTRENLSKSPETLYWNPQKGVFPDINLGDIDACFNLCGAPVFDRPFTRKRRQQLVNSRVMPLEFLDLQFEKSGYTLPHLVSASASGIYPYICLNEINENSTTGSGFIPDLVKVWEAAANGFRNSAGTSILRIGIVLAKEGGFLAKLSRPVKYFAGAVPGNGLQVISWIHIDDLADMLIWVMENRIEGTFNAAAPKPVPLRTIMQFTAKTLGRPLLLPDIPAWILQMIFGEERARLILTSQHLSSKKIEDTGFTFRFTDHTQAISHLLSA